MDCVGDVMPAVEKLAGVEMREYEKWDVVRGREMRYIQNVRGRNGVCSRRERERAGERLRK